MGARPLNLCILGSTGSIGRQTLEVVRWFPDRFRVVGLAAGSFSPQFRAQLDEFNPPLVAVGRPERGESPTSRPTLVGTEGLVALATDPGVDMVVIATVGRAGLAPTLAAASGGKRLALANKEALVMAGNLVVEAANRSGARILPVDSEHSAIWQCLRGEGDTPSEWRASVRALHLTASGGALRDLPAEELDRVPPARVLNHPTWQMGPKVTVDSATLMNKGLEVMEARWLFDIPLDRIKVVLHRESIVHSLVEFVDGSVKAQLGPPDMRLPIQYALAYPDRLDAVVEPLTLTRMGVLTFGEVEMARYPCLRLALHAARMGDSYPAALSAANEVAVTLFLSGRITFGTIPSLVEEVLSRHQPVRMDGLEAVQAVDDWAQSLCRSLTDDWRAG